MYDSVGRTSVGVGVGDGGGGDDDDGGGSGGGGGGGRRLLAVSGRRFQSDGAAIRRTDAPMQCNAASFV